MSETSPMYHMKPVFCLPAKLPRANVMYEMKNIHDYDRIATQIEQQASHPELAALEARQEKILGQLAELRQIIASLFVMVQNKDESETATSIQKEEVKKDPVRLDLVLKVDNNQIPYSLLALRKLWQDTCFNHVSSHIHSDKHTLKDTQEIRAFEKMLYLNKGAQRNKHFVNLRLIWKNTDTLELNMGLPKKHLLGETALLRLLSRTISSHSYENEISPEDLNSVDTILDQCYEASLANRDHIMKDVLMKFDDALRSGSTWLKSKNQPTIADVAAWSVIKNNPRNKLPNNVSKWFDRCEKQFCC